MMTKHSISSGSVAGFKQSTFRYSPSLGDAFSCFILSIHFKPDQF